MIELRDREMSRPRGFFGCSAWRIPLSFLILLLFSGLIPGWNTSGQTGGSVTVVGTIENIGVEESSGLAASGVHPGVIWTHNDAGTADFIFAITREGKHRGAYQLKGAAMVDWEAITTDGRGNLFLADTGTNGMARSHSAVHRLEEPSLEKTTGNVEIRHTWLIRFPGEREDCESILVADEYVYLISKYPKRSTVGLYRFPMWAGGESILLEAVARIPLDGSVSDAALSPNRDRLAMITNKGLLVIFINGNLANAETAYRQLLRYENTTLEGVTFLGEEILVTGEGSKDILLFSGPLLTGAPGFSEILLNQIVYPGDTVEFEVEAFGFPAPTLTWYFNGEVIPNQTGATLVLPNVTDANAGLYEVVASNANGTARSAAVLALRDRINVRITEIMPLPSSTNGVPKADWFELTNFETNAVSLAGWRFNDDSGGLEDAFVIPPRVSLDPGESMIFVEGLSPEEFRAWWGETNLSPGLKIVTYSGIGLSFGATGDTLRIWEPGALNEDNVITEAEFENADPGVSFAYDPASGQFGSKSQAGVNGAFRAAAAEDVGSPGIIRGEITPPGEKPDLRITEVMSSGVGGGGLLVEDWWELTSFHTNMVNLQGWRFNDSVGGLGDPYVIPNEVLIEPGETIIFVELMTEEQFRAWWGSANIPAGTKIISYTGNELSFSAQGDSLFLWSNTATDTTDFVDRVDFGAADPGVTFSYDPASEELVKSQPGVNGAFQAVLGPDIGSPGLIGGGVEPPELPDLRITEVMSNPAPAPVPSADWWELTNFETNSVNLGGWRFNDGEGGFADPFVIPAGTVIGPGESIIFVEELSEEEFRTWWGAADVPAGTQIITYSGSGLAFSSLGDAVILWNRTTANTNDVVASAVFGAAQPGVTFNYDPDNEEFGAPSQLGVNGVFRALNGSDIGSPGLIRGDTPPPTRMDLRITEVMANPTEAIVTTGDWWELTSFAAAPIDLSGWRFNDNSGGLVDPFVIPAGTIIEPGQSIIFVEELSGSEFFAWWGAVNLDPDTEVITYDGLGLGLSATEDSVILWDSTTFDENAWVLRVDFQGSDIGRSFTYDPATGLFGSRSEVGVNGAFVAQNAADIASPGRIAGELAPPVTPGDIQITEVMPSPFDSVTTADWFEVTNFGTNVVDLSGWRFNDENSLVDAFVFPAGIAISPGESIILVEDLTPAQFRAWWGSANVPAGRQIVTYTGIGLASGGDSVLLWDSSAVEGETPDARVDFGPADTGVTFVWNPNLGLVAVKSVEGVNGAFRSATGTDVGSPGILQGDVVPPDEAPDLRITEIMASPTLSTFVSTADWWELTSFETNAVSLAGWRFNDNDGGLADPFVIPGGIFIAPGESIIFVEGLSAQDFLEWWGAANIRPGTQIVTYPTGSGLGFSSVSDAAILWNSSAVSAGDYVARVDFENATPGVTIAYDPATGEFVTSQVGVNGAFRAEGSTDVGSPGTIGAVESSLLVQVGRVADYIQISFQARSGWLYRLEFKEAVEGTIWSPTGQSIQGTANGPASFQEAMTSTMRFYRVVEE